MIAERLSGWARLYIASITLLGACAIAQSAYVLYAVPMGWNWFILSVLTLLSGSATVKLPAVPATISVSETFVFTSVILFGPAAGTVTVALDALVISLWLARRGHPFYRIAFNVCALPASLWLGAHLFYWTWGSQPLSLVSTPVEIRGLILPLILFTVTYFLLNSWLIACAISLEKHLTPLRVWRDNFAWLSLNYFGGASVAALLATYTRDIDYAYLAFVLPLLAVLYFTFSMSMGRVEDANRHLRDLNKLYMSTIETLAMAIDAKDQITHGHIRRVQRYATALARALGITEPAQLSAIEAASLLHDMGKLAVPEYILNKPGPLTAAEFEKMKLHASVGADILSSIDFPYPVVPIVRHHHESWDGTGYPDGLEGSAIPLGARILSVVDCFDALTSDRPYRPRLSDAAAVAILIERRGSMYDPLIVDSFIALHSTLTKEQILDSEDRKAAINSIGHRGSPPENEQRASPLEDITASTEEALVLYELARALTGYLDMREVGEAVAKHVRRMIPASTCVLYTYDSVADELKAVHVAGEGIAHLSGIRIPRGERLSGWVAANKQTILNSNPLLDLGEVGRTMKPRLRNCLSTPILSGTELVGVLTLYTTETNAFTENHRRVIEAVARQVADSVTKASDSDHPKNIIHTAHHRLSLPGPQTLERALAAELELNGPNRFLSLLFVVIESPKAFNVSRPTGRDERLAALIAERLVGVLRKHDTLFQSQPDEYVILLAQTDFDAAALVAGRIASDLAEALPSHHTSLESRMQVTIRIATAPQDGMTVSDLAASALTREAIGSFSLQFNRLSVH